MVDLELGQSCVEGKLNLRAKGSELESHIGEDNEGTTTSRSRILFWRENLHDTSTLGSTALTIEKY